MREKVYFLSHSAQQSDYWARQLGFQPHEWLHIHSLERVLSLRKATVYVVGTWAEDDTALSLLDELEARGIEAILAEEMVPIP